MLPGISYFLRTAKKFLVLVWCGKSVKLDRVYRTFVELNLGSTHGIRRLNQMSRQCRSKVELVQLGSAHEKYIKSL